MASTYVNDLRLEEIGTGEKSGSWGTVTNTNLELIAEAFSYGSEAIANASTHTITVADGASDEARSLYLKCTDGGQACTVTLAPNTLSKVWIIENATSYTLTFSQGTGANVAVLAGQVKMIATDGAGGGAVVYDLLTDVNLAGTTVYSALNDGTTTLTSTVAELNIMDGVTATAAELNILDGVTSTTAELNILDGVTSTAAELNLVDGSSAGSIVNSKAVIYSSAGVVNATDMVVTGSGNRSLSVSSTDAVGSIEVGSAAGNQAFIDLKTPTSDDYDVRLQSESGGSGGSLNVTSGNLTLSGSGKTSAVFDGDGAVSLYHNNSVKIATASGGVNVTGTLTATTEVTVSSDVRFKSNIETIDSALDKVKAMRGVYFDKKDKRSVGVIAQEMQEVMPEVVVTDDTEDKHLSVAYGNLVGVLIEAVKELSDKVEKLGAK